MDKYHINARGEPGLCRARKQCPFGGVNEHYSSPEEARDAYEKRMEASLKSSPYNWNPQRFYEKFRAIKEETPDLISRIQRLDPGLAFVLTDAFADFQKLEGDDT